jgi:hypothetical protein
MDTDDTPHANQPSRAVHAWLRPAAAAAGTLAVPGAALVAALAWNRAGGSTGLSGWVGGLFIGGLCIAVVASILVSLCLRSSARRVRHAVVWTAGACVALAVAVELGVRSLAERTAGGLRLGATELLPHEWGTLTGHLRSVHAQLRGRGGPVAYDSLLGWDGARDWRPAHGSDATDATGRRVGVGPADEPRAGPWIALLGDSFTFAEEVAFERSWGQVLARALGVPVANFGVSSHGIEQTLLKYLRDVAPTRPTVVVYGLLNGSPPRLLNVYSFLRPEREYPYGKPRVRFADGSVTFENVPVPDPDAMLAVAGPAELPAVELDAWFSPTEWRRSPMDASIAWRVLATRFRHWPEVSAREDPAWVAAVLLGALDRAVRENGGHLLVAHLPRGAEVDGKPGAHARALRALLAAEGIGWVDTAPCLRSLADADRWASSGGHYSASANDAVARCVAPAVAGIPGVVPLAPSGAR